MGALQSCANENDGVVRGVHKGGGLSGAGSVSHPAEGRSGGSNQQGVSPRITVLAVVKKAERDRGQQDAW
jgi:hypothetical protein